MFHPDGSSPLLELVLLEVLGNEIGQRSDLEEAQKSQDFIHHLLVHCLVDRMVKPSHRSLSHLVELKPSDRGSVEEQAEYEVFGRIPEVAPAVRRPGKMIQHDIEKPLFIDLALKDQGQSVNIAV